MNSHVWTDSDLWHANLSAPRRDIMKFNLIYSGPLSASGNKPKTSEAARIRDKLSGQMKYLWETSRQLKSLEDEAWVDPRAPNLGFGQTPNGIINVGGRSPTMRERASMMGGMESLTQPLLVNGYQFKPLVRASLNMMCDVSVLFLRQEDPGALISQGGDIDNRIKTLLDALRIPTDQEVNVVRPEGNSIVYCLMESDTLVSSLNVETERLLFPTTEFPNEVHLVIEVSIRLLEINRANVVLL